MFTLNPNFSHAQRRVVVNSIQASDTPKEKEETTARVFIDRINVVDAIIVRILKSKKSCSFRVLVGEVFEGLRFPIEVCGWFM